MNGRLTQETDDFFVDKKKGIGQPAWFIFLYSLFYSPFQAQFSIDSFEMFFILNISIMPYSVYFILTLENFIKKQRQN